MGLGYEVRLGDYHEDKKTDTLSISVFLNPSNLVPLSDTEHTAGLGIIVSDMISRQVRGHDVSISLRAFYCTEGPLVTLVT